MQVFVSLGSNKGDRERYLQRALALLDRVPQTKVVKVSQVYESPPWGFPEQRDFLNLVAELRTRLGAQRLLAQFKALEQQMGRKPSRRWGPREIDVDLLLYGSERITTPELTVPHERMMERAFVLVPLAEIAPDLALPDGRSAQEHAVEREHEVVRYATISIPSP
jgi:2-amino-4-hydroxy-6-hydroxymethyldihydropteridine diphosphokinase